MPKGRSTRPRLAVCPRSGVQIELALPGNRVRNAVVKIDLEGLRKAGYKIPRPTRVTGRFGRPGSGWEYEFDSDIQRMT
jgi:hypothetical protein